MTGLLFGVQPTDPATIIGDALVLILASASAAYMPARRASHVDPLVASRRD